MFPHVVCSPEQTLNKRQLPSFLPSAVGSGLVLEVGGGEKAAAARCLRAVPTLHRGTRGLSGLKVSQPLRPPLMNKVSFFWLPLPIFKFPL